MFSSTFFLCRWTQFLMAPTWLLARGTWEGSWKSRTSGVLPFRRWRDSGREGNIPRGRRRQGVLWRGSPVQASWRGWSIRRSQTSLWFPTKSSKSSEIMEHEQWTLLAVICVTWGISKTNISEWEIYCCLALYSLDATIGGIGNCNWRS